jgi:membrane-associated phospholipid phosphatase
MNNQRGLWWQEIKRHKNLIFISILFLIIAVTINQFAGNYVEKKQTVAVPDIILDNLPTIDLDLIFVYGFILIGAILLFYPLFFDVKKLHIALSQFSLLVLIRSFFISLTHLSMPLNALSYKAPEFFIFFGAKNALFFSGHTAVPFLGYLIFRKQKIGIFFLISTVIMAATVLLMHVHYSIDVFAALFITYGSYKIGQRLFKGVE